MKKTYKTLASSAVIQVSTPRGVRPVHFRNGFIGRGTLRGGVFTTEDEELQKGIESHKRFQTGFSDEIWTDDKEPVPAKKNVEPVKEEPKKEEPSVDKAATTGETTGEEKVAEKEVETEETKKATEETPIDEAPANTDNDKPTFPEVTKMAEVRAILKEQYGKTAAEVKTNAQVLALINELGLVFPNLK